MDGKGLWMDNAFSEGLFRSVKWECVYLLGYESGQNSGKLSLTFSISITGSRPTTQQLLLWNQLWDRCD